MKLKPLSEAGEYLNRLADIENYPFAALNGSCLEQGFLLEIKPGARFDRPLVLTYFTRPEGRNLLENIRNIIVVGAGSEIDLIEYYHYAGEVKSRYLLNQVNEILLPLTPSLIITNIRTRPLKPIILRSMRWSSRPGRSIMLSACKKAPISPVTKPKSDCSAVKPAPGWMPLI